MERFLPLVNESVKRVFCDVSEDDQLDFLEIGFHCRSVCVSFKAILFTLLFVFT